jgi:septal ring factor EnvC (AmiA/AmiB activator)
MKNQAARYENAILQRRLFEAGQINQSNEVRMRSLQTQNEELTKLRETLSDYRKAFELQREELESTKREHALTAQSLTHEFKCHEATEKSFESLLELERVRIQDLMGLLDILSGRAGSNDDRGIGTLWHENESMKARLSQQDLKITRLEAELQNTKDELQHKRLQLDDLWGDMNAEQENTLSRPPTESSEEGEVKTALLLPPGPNKQRKRMRSLK